MDSTRGNQPDENSDRARLSRAGIELVKQSVAEIVAPRTTSWECLASVLGLWCLFVMSLTPADSAELPIAVVIVLAFTFGFAVSAVRQRNTNGRLIAGIVLVITGTAIVGMCMLSLGS